MTDTPKMPKPGQTIDISLTKDRIKDRYGSLDKSMEKTIEERAKSSMEGQNNKDPNKILINPPKPKDNMLAPRSLDRNQWKKFKDDWEKEVYIYDELYEQYLRQCQFGNISLITTFKTYLERCLITVRETIVEIKNKRFTGQLGKDEYDFNLDLAKLSEDAIKWGIQNESKKQLKLGVT